MTKAIFGAILAVSFFSCNAGGEKKVNKEAQIKSINESSTKNQQLYNRFEQEKAVAVQSGDAARATSLQMSMDSVMRANAMLGDSLIRVQNGE